MKIALAFVTIVLVVSVLLGVAYLLAKFINFTDQQDMNTIATIIARTRTAEPPPPIRWIVVNEATWEALSSPTPERTATP